MSVGTDVVVHWIFGILFGWVLLLALLGIIKSARVEKQKRVLVSVAVANGMLLAVNISPLVTLAAEISQLTPLFSDNYVELIRRLLNGATVVNIIAGGGKMYQKSRKAGVFAFLLALAGGFIFIEFIEIFPVGFVIIVFAFGFEEASQTIKF